MIFTTWPMNCLAFNTPLHRGWLRPLCLPCVTTKPARSPLKAQTSLKGCLCHSGGGAGDVQTSPWTPRSPWSFEHVQNQPTMVAEEPGRSQVAQRRQGEGTRVAVVAEWMQREGSAVGLPVNMRTVINILYQFEQCFCLPCTTVVPPLVDQ